MTLSECAEANSVGGPCATAGAVLVRPPRAIGTRQEGGIESRRPYVVPIALCATGRGMVRQPGRGVANQSQTSYARARLFERRSRAA